MKILKTFIFIFVFTLFSLEGFAQRNSGRGGGNPGGIEIEVKVFVYEDGSEVPFQEKLIYDFLGDFYAGNFQGVLLSGQDSPEQLQLGTDLADQVEFFLLKVILTIQEENRRDQERIEAEKQERVREIEPFFAPKGNHGARGRGVRGAGNPGGNQFPLVAIVFYDGTTMNSLEIFESLDTVIEAHLDQEVQKVVLESGEIIDLDEQPATLESLTQYLNDLSRIRE